MHELMLSMHRRSKSFPCPSEIEFFNRIDQQLPLADQVRALKVSFQARL
jgi:hypothetical protein